MFLPAIVYFPVPLISTLRDQITVDKSKTRCRLFKKVVMNMEYSLLFTVYFVSISNFGDTTYFSYNMYVYFRIEQLS